MDFRDFGGSGAHWVFELAAPVALAAMQDPYEEHVLLQEFPVGEDAVLRG